MKNKIIAIVPAAGTGKRFGDKTNKPFEYLNNKPLIVWSLEVLEGMSEIYEIIPVLKDTDMEHGVEIFEQYNISKVRRIAPGGKERQDSVFQGLRLIDEKRCMVLVHDGVRPLIESHVIREAIKQFKDCDGVVIGVPLKDTVKQVKQGDIKKTLKRDLLWSVQTPQIFFYKPLYEAYKKARKGSFYSTDDSALVEKYGGRVKIVMGSHTNIKVTTPEDLLIAELFLKQRSEQT